MRPHSQLLILALLGVQVAAQTSCDPAALGQSAATKAEEDVPAATAAAAAATTTQDGTPGDAFPDGKILSQAPPIRALSRGNPTVDSLYMMFPALGSLIHWGSLFPAYSFLGAPAPGSEAAASKVVLVLADDAAAKTRVTRQNDPASQPNPFSFLTNFQNLPNMPSFDHTLVGQSLGQSLMNPPNLPGLLQNLPGLSNLGMLAAAPPVPVPAPAPAPAADAAEAAPVPAPAATPVAAPAPAWLNFDTKNMLGQTMSMLGQMQPPQAPNLPPLPPANFDFLGQMFPTQAASDISEVRVRPEVAYAPQAQVAQLKIKSALEKETEKEQQQQQQQGEEQERVPLLWFRMPSNPTTTTEEKTLEDLRVEAKLRAFERQVISELKMLQKIELMAKEMRSSASPTQGKESPFKISYPLSRTPVHKITRSDIERALRDDYVRRLLQKEAQRKARITQDTHRSAGSYKRQAEKPGQSMSKEDIVQIMAYAYRMASEQMEAAEKGKQDKVYAAYRTDSEEAAKAIEQQEQIQQQQQQQRQMMQGPQMIQQSPMMIQQQQERQMIQQQQQQLERQMMTDPQAIQQQQRQMMQGPQMIQQTPMMPRQMAETPQMIQQNPMMIQQQQQQERQMIQQQQQQRQMMTDPQAIQQQMQQRQEAEIQQRQMAAEEPQMIQQNPTMMQRQMMAEDSNQQQQQRQMIQQNPINQQQRQMIQQNPTMMQQQMLETEPQAIQQMQQRQWAEEQAKIQQNAMMQQQQQQPQQPRQMMQNPTQMIQQNPSIMMQQRQMAAENPAMQQQLQWTEDPARVQQIQQQMQQRSEEQGPMMPMMMPAERQWAEEKTKAIAIQQQMSQPEGQENQETDDDLILGEAGPQMPENEGGARHKGNLYGVFRNRDSISVSPTVDPLGLGGNKRKKSKSKGKSGPPTVVNLYYSTPVQQRPSYAAPSYAPPSYAPPSYAPRPSYAPSPSYAAPSYGTSYGGGGYGSNAYGAGSSSYQQRPAASAGYRAAVGNEEVDEMLRRHQTLSRTLNPQPDQVARSGSTAAPSLTTTTPAPAPTPPTTAHRVHKRLAIFQSRLGRDASGNGHGNGDGSNSAAKGCSCGRSQCPCGSSCQCGSSRGWGTSRCPCQGAKSSGNRRQRRSTAEYGTLETIDEGSLNELRREYKMGLKEITLSPDEDPAEALMRYNAASIREALERASQVPLEIGGDQYAEDMPQEPQEDAEQMQHQHHHHQHHHHQYHHQDFVRLTPTAAPPLSNTTEASVTTEATPITSTSTSTVSPPARLTDEEEMQQDAAAAETSRVAEAMSQQKEEIHELHKAVHALKMQLLDANRRCKKIQEQLKVNLVQEPAKEEEEKLEEGTKQEEEKDPGKEEEPQPKVEEQAKELVKEKEPEKPAEAEEKSGTTTKAEEQPEQEEEEEQEEETESTGSSTTTTETPPTSPSPPVTPTPSPSSPPSPPLTRSKEANAIAKVDEVHGSITAAASASLDANKLAYEEEEEEGNWQRILANRGYDTEYLTKSHERQYAEGGNLELPKGLPYESPLSQEYASYPDFQADEPASPVAADSEGKAKRAAVPLSVKLRAHMLNVALKGSDRRDVATPPTPYALRGKFVRRRSTAAGSSSSSGRRRNTRISRMSQEETESPSEQGWVRSTRQARLPQRPKRKVTTPLAKKVTTPLAKKVTTPLTKKVRTKKQNTVSGRVSTQASVSSTKLDRLVDVLNDLLHLQLQKERRASASKGNAALNALSKPSSSSKLIKRKRVRRRQSTEAPMRM